MGKITTKVIVKSHYIGEKKVSDVFQGILKNHIFDRINNLAKTDLKNDENYEIMDTSNLLSESEALC